MSDVAQEKEFEGIFEPTGNRPLMSKPPRVHASKKLIREVASALRIDDDDTARDAADWIADKMERFGARTAEGVIDMHGNGPVCSWCKSIWPLCGCSHLSEVDFEDDDVADNGRSAT